ncbi:hypothetical protein [Bradyrhizobium sp. HKCCYLS3013]|uniref:hypothetical protein n=1 Tax=Bradyrhizobium sp. HKCCYLS3013 TaxID=3420735 RepID=UPI003EB915D8
MFLISASALALSALTAYYNVVRQKEELRIYLGGRIPLITRASNGSLLVDGRLDVAFMNTGTRPILISSMYLEIDDIPEGPGAHHKPCSRPFGSLAYSVDSFVLKEKDSVAKLVDLKVDPQGLWGSKHVNESGQIVTAAPKNSHGEPSRSVGVCVNIYGASPSEPYLRTSIEIADFEWPAAAQSEQELPNVSFSPEKRRAIWAKEGTIFDMN